MHSQAGAGSSIYWKRGKMRLTDVDAMLELEDLGKFTVKEFTDPFMDLLHRKGR